MTGKKFQTTYGRCKQNAHSNSMCRCAQCVTTHTEQHDHVSSREHAWLKIAHLCVPKQLSSMSCFIPCRTWHWPQAQALFHLPHLSFRRSLPHAQVLWRTIHIYPSKIHGRVEDQHKSHLSQKGRHAVFFTAVNPMFMDHYREKDYDVTKPRIAVYKHTWKIHHNTVYWCNLRVAQSKGTAVLSNTVQRDHLLQHFTCGVYRKGGDQEVRRRIEPQNVSTSERNALKPSLNCERQDTTSSDARTSFDHASKHGGKYKETCGGGVYKETCRGEKDFILQGLPHSTVQQDDHTRKKAVQKLIHQFETHPNRTELQADLKQNHAFNPFSEQSKDMIYSMGNMEYFEICEITPKVASLPTKLAN